MSSGSPRLRIVGSPPARKRPGPAFLAVLVYALLFLAALWAIRSRTSHAGKSMPPARPAPRSPAPARPRNALLSPDGLSGVASDEYFRRLSMDCCTCGCDLNLRDCLVSDQACARSPELAGNLLDEVR